MIREVLYGPPGTGKTTRIISKVKQFIDQGIPHSRIGLCSYTKAAAEVLGERSGLKSRYVGTIHSIAYRQSEIVREQVINYERLKQFSTLCGIEISGGNVQDESSDLKEGDHYLALYSYAKSVLTEDYRAVYEQSEQPGTLTGFLFFIKNYVAWKNKKGYVDYTDMLERALNHDAPDLNVLIIDEAQDLSPLQWKLIDYWQKGIANVIISGDDDQCIYGWGGADPKGMVKFEERYNASRTVLNQSWRIPNAVHEKAGQVIKHSKERVQKEYKPRLEEGVLVYQNNLAFMSELNPQDSTLILYRNHSMRSIFEEELICHSIPYHVEGGKPGLLQGAYAQAIQLFFKLQRNLDMTEMKKSEHMLLDSFLKGDYKKYLMNPSGIQHIAWYVALSMPYRIESFFRGLEKKYGTLAPPTNIKLSTIHASKGREADRVIILNNIGERTYSKLGDDGVLGNEARVFYVGVTRAKHRLDVVSGDVPIFIL